MPATIQRNIKMHIDHVHLKIFKICMAKDILSKTIPKNRHVTGDVAQGKSRNHPLSLASVISLMHISKLFKLLPPIYSKGLQTTWSYVGREKPPHLIGHFHYNCGQNTWENSPKGRLLFLVISKARFMVTLLCALMQKSTAVGQGGKWGCSSLSRQEAKRGKHGESRQDTTFQDTHAMTYLLQTGSF